MLLINRTLIEMSDGMRKWIIIIAALKTLVLVATTNFAITMSDFLGNLMNPNMNMADFKSAIITAVFAAIFIFVGEFLIGECEYRLTSKARVTLREKIMRKILDLDVGNVDRIGATKAVASAVDGVESIHTYYSNYLPSLIFCIIAPVYLFFRIKTLSFSIAVVLLVSSLSIMPINNAFRKVINQLKTDYWSSFQDLTGYYLESINGLVALKLFNRDEDRKSVLREKANNFNNIIMKVMKVNFSSFLLSDGLIYATVFACMIMAANQLISGKIVLSAALAILMLSYTYFTSLRQLMNATHQALTGIAASQNISDILNISSDRAHMDKPDSSQASDDNKIEFKNVSFSYEGRKTILNNISITIEKGKITAFAGRSGSGKSTIAGLLMRFFDPESGQIFINGVDYRCHEPDEIRENIKMVPQYVSIFAGTIEDNLLIAKPDATESEMMEALKIVRLDEWVKGLPDGLGSTVGDSGDKLSGGQRQKIGIARAFLCNAQYIMFDEATSNVDVESENEIWAAINDMAESRTLIIISHRLSTIRQADCIYILSSGGIEDKGNHNQLMSREGLYKELVREQAELEAHGERKVS